MASRSHVRVVAPDERPPVKLKTLAEAVEGGDYLEILLAQRREIVTSLPNEKGPAKAALHRQLSLISKEIVSLESSPSGAATISSASSFATSPRRDPPD